ncbi:peptidoglycan D,D-transpeptidase FtsI family protein [Pseudoneobacillus rhizosphaerae]|uniref:peptidoglycan D,D-transpeptidase FtsI family protein n=1 Tax=Pseudoneobacillus rhizosphaerae TaxID=2880968 RepID=UPI001E2FFD3D|nr:penicillin-binding protein 2 [Pseudoneobacillus rhizosphaerae]
MNILETQKNTKKTLPFRLNILFLIVFICFSILVIKLGTLQIVKGEDFRKEISRTENHIVREPVPRGKIYDRNGRIVVDNDGKNAISYTKAKDTKQDEILEVAKKLSQLIVVKTDKLTERDLKDYWILTRPEEAVAKLTKAELSNKKLESKDLYKLQLERISTADLSKISMKEKQVASIFREMAKGYALTPQIVKNDDVKVDEIARVSENLESLPGVDVFTDWKRMYPNGDTFRSILGNISTDEEGLPANLLDYYLSRDYSRNDRVGKSQIELQYEDVLSGQKAKTEYEVGQSGKIEQSKMISEGKRGKDLVLTIDLELQKKVEEILEKQLVSGKQNGGGPFLDRAFVVMTNPKTGEVLSMSGKKLTFKNGKYEVDDYALGTFTSSYEMGSVVKGATILTGYQTGVIQPNTYLVDEPIQLASTPIKKSWRTMGRINDLEALRRSSNVYMFKTAIRSLGSEYYHMMKIPLNYDAFDTYRYYFNQFGLGVRTGIDLPSEAAGLPGSNSPNFLLDFTIGQYDTYTPMQLAQYVSTIANDGYRAKLQMVKEIREPNLESDLGQIQHSFEPVILNQVDMKDEYIKRVQEGFRQVYQESGGTATSYFGSKPYSDYNLAGKTGTAQSFYYDSEKKKLYVDEPTFNLTLVGYAPFDNPEVAFSVVVPYVKSDKHPINKLIGQDIIKAYFELKEQAPVE